MLACTIAQVAIANTYPNTYFPLEIANNTKVAGNDQVYVYIKAQTINAPHHACVMKFNSQGQGDCIVVNDQTKMADYNYPLSFFPKAKNANNAFAAYLPPTISGRIYFSIGSPMVFYTTKGAEGQHTIPDPDGFKTRDPDYYKLYDKVEYSYNQLGTWINPTAVDFFSIPIGIHQASSQSLKNSGFGKSSRTEIFNQVKSELAIAKEKTPSTFKDWNKLWLNFEGNFADGSTGNTILRFMAPGKAMTEPNPLSANIPFAPNYLTDDKLGLNYINAIWDYYKTHNNQVGIDTKEINQGKPQVFLIKGVDENNNLIFSDGKTTVKISKPQSISFFAGAQGSFNAANNTPKAIIVRELTSAFEVGLLPFPAMANKDGITVINKSYFETQKQAGRYYTENPLLAAGNTGPWYDLYSKALHSVGNDQPIYTFAYDDALGQDGTLHDPNANDIGLVKIKLGDMTGAKIPAPAKDNNRYQITAIVGGPAVVTVNGHEVTAKTSGPIRCAGNTICELTVPLEVTYDGKPYQIDLAHPMVKPYNTWTDSIVITKTGKNSYTLIFPANNA